MFVWEITKQNSFQFIYAAVSYELFPAPLIGKNRTDQLAIDIGATRDNFAFCGERKNCAISSQNTTKPHKMIKKFKIIATRCGIEFMT